MPLAYYCYTKKMGPSDLLVYSVEFLSHNYRQSIAQLYNLASRADTWTRLLEMLPSPNQTKLTGYFQPFLGGLPGKGMAGMAVCRPAIFVFPAFRWNLSMLEKPLEFGNPNDASPVADSNIWLWVPHPPGCSHLKKLDGLLRCCPSDPSDHPSMSLDVS